MSINHLPPKVLCSGVSNTTTPSIGYGNAAELQQQVVALRADFAALQHAIVGDTGASAILTAERLRAELAASREREARMRGIGGQLSNVAFNLAQRAGHVISSDDCSLLDGLRKQWDAALAEGAQG